MRQSKTTRAMALMLSLTMVTSVFVGNTLSRYVTSVSSTDSARVVVWGINGEETTMNLFDTKYLKDEKTIAKSNSNDPEDKIIAPGTKGEAEFNIINFEQDVPPEVAYEVSINLDDSAIDERILNNPSIQWKLDNNEFGTWDQLKTSILSLAGNPSGKHTYEPGQFATAFQGTQTHKIAWQWILDDNNDVMDTNMGNLALDGPIEAVVKVSITAQQTDGESSVYNIVNLPDDFSDVPIILKSNGSKYEVEHDFSQYVYDTSIYVDGDNGSDSTGDGSEDNPYKTIKKAESSITADTNIYVKSSVPFLRNQGLWGEDGSVSTYNVSYFNNNGDGSNILSVPAQTGLSWTAEDNVFVTSRTYTKNILYKDNSNAVFGWSNLIEVESLDDCKSTTGSWYTDNTNVYINTFDGTIPTIDNYLVVIANTGANAVTLEDGQTIYVEGFTFISADVNNSAYFGIEDGVKNTRVVLKDCIAGQNDTNVSSSNPGNGFSFVDISEVLLFDCIVKDTHSDGFNYHYSAAMDSYEGIVVEVNCEAYNCGMVDGAGINNLSTCHDNGRIIRVNTYGRNSGGPLIADVGSCKSLNFGCDIGGATGNYSYQFSGDNSYALLANCIDDGTSRYGSTYPNGNLYLYDFNGDVYLGNVINLDSLEEISEIE